MQIASLGKARRQGGSRHNLLFKYDFVVMVVCISNEEGIGTPLEISLVSIHGKEYQYPSSLMELECRYWLSSNDTGCLRTELRCYKCEEGLGEEKDIT
ncbi:hypothetical protein GQ457_01G017980 [Hibiscus cannabinus]